MDKSNAEIDRLNDVLTSNLGRLEDILSGMKKTENEISEILSSKKFFEEKEFYLKKLIEKL